MARELRLELHNRIPEIERVAEALEQFGAENALSPRGVLAANLALEELIVNIISYAWDDEGDHLITLGMSLGEGGNDRELTLVLEDDGRPFNPFEMEDRPLPEIPLDNLEDLCLGIHFVRMLVDRHHYVRRDGRNVLRLSLLDVPDKKTITSMMSERRVFPPARDFAGKARVRSLADYREEYERSVADPAAYWAEKAEELTWFKRWEQTLVHDFANGRHEWFLGGRINVSVNCLDRHLDTWRKNKAALVWEGDRPGESRTLTYQQLHREVCRFANVLHRHGVRKGDRVTLYLPMVPELPIAMLACARIGAIHSVVFGGFSAESLRARIVDCESSLLVCADGYFRGGKVVRSKDVADRALEGLESLRSVIVVRRAGIDVPFKAGRDFWWDAETADPGLSDACEPEQLDAEDPLFILYTSGSTGKPKGVLHTQAGYLLYVSQTFKTIFDLRDEDTYWCTADIGWVTGHSYIVYGPLANGATSLMFEGTPAWPHPDRFWEVVEKHRVSIFYTAPTALRALMKEGDEWPSRRDLSSLRLLGTVGEPINPEAWMWYYRVIGKSRCPIVDTWWQTETGGILIAPIPGAVPAKPGSATLPFFGIRPEVIKEDMSAAAVNEGGWLVVRHPWPGLMRRVYGDPERFKKTYFSQFYGAYTTGDSARIDEDGYFWLMGRIDDVINVSGHRLGTAEVESALVSHPAVAEAAVVGFSHEIKGQGIYAFVTLKTGVRRGDALDAELKRHVREQIGAIAAPDRIQFAEGLPKTRSGKIMRRVLTRIAAGDVTDLGDVSTLSDPSVVEDLVRNRA